VATASQVPERFDCVIDGQGYLLAPSDAGLPPSVFGVKPEFSYSPTFVQRQNVSGDYGDNQQDFWLTASQRDWSLGEQQRNFRSNDPDSVRRYWKSTGLNVTRTPGQAFLPPDTVAFSATVTPLAWGSGGIYAYISTSTNLYKINAGNVTNLGAHTIGGAPGLTGGVAAKAFAFDGKYLYLSSEAGTKVRKLLVGADTFSDFSTTPASGLAYLNNSLYGIRNAGTHSDLIRYDTAGAVTVVFTWKGAEGSELALKPVAIAPYGGKLLVLVSDGSSFSLWLYDGTAPSKVADFDSNFTPSDIVVSQGEAFFPGLLSESSLVPCVNYYTNGTLGTLWKAKILPPAKNNFGCAAWGGGLVIQDPGQGVLLYYDASNGGVSTLGPTTVGSSTNNYPLVATDGEVYVFTSGSTNAYRYPSGVADGHSLTTSLFDFDSSLSKLFRGIKVEFDSATDGNGGTVDIAFRVGDVDGSYTALQTTAVSGTEYTLSGISGRSISVKVTLNKGTSTNGPVLKRISVRAVPLQTQFRQCKYVLYLGGSRKRDPIESQMITLRDGTIHTKDGKAMVADIVTAATSTTPFAVTDGVNGTMSNCLIDIGSGELKITQIKPGEFIAVVPVREV
jgi:hypothetical protein